MKSLGILSIVAGAFVLYAVVHGKLASPSSSSPSSSPGSSSSGKQSPASSDIGSHQGIDLTGNATGAVGSLYTIGSDYAGMTDQQKDDANAYAHQIGNG